MFSSSLYAKDLHNDIEQHAFCTGYSDAKVEYLASKHNQWMQEYFTGYSSKDKIVYGNDANTIEKLEERYKNGYNIGNTKNDEVSCEKEFSDYLKSNHFK